MRVAHVLSASVIAGILLFAGTACGTKETVQEPITSPSVSASATPSATSSETPSIDVPDDALIGPTAPGVTAPASPDESETPEAPVASSPDSIAITAVLNDYYAFTGTPEASAILDTLTAKFEAGKPTPEMLNEAVASYPEIYKYYDTSTNENTENATLEFFSAAQGARSSAAAEQEVTFTAPADGIVITGDSASLDISSIIITVDGERMEGTSSGQETLDLTKKDGKWVMVAKAGS